MGSVLGGTGAAVLAGDVLLCVAVLTFGSHAVLNSLFTLAK